MPRKNSRRKGQRKVRKFPAVENRGDDRMQPGGGELTDKRLTKESPFPGSRKPKVGKV